MFEQEELDSMKTKLDNTYVSNVSIVVFILKLLTTIILIIVCWVVFGENYINSKVLLLITIGTLVVKFIKTVVKFIVLKE